jgi:hypothetical protein
MLIALIRSAGATHADRRDYGKYRLTRPARPTLAQDVVAQTGDPQNLVALGRHLCQHLVSDER